MKKLLLLFFLTPISHADIACMQQGADGRMYVAETVNIPSQPPENEAPAVISFTPGQATMSFTTIGSLPPAETPGYIYYTLPGGLKLITPWSAGILAEGYDFIGHEGITQGYFPLAQFWKITGVFGGGINGRGEGSPMGGAIIDLARVPVSDKIDFHVALTGGYNFNAHHALAVLSGSVQFLK
jgi:hypothetical protein